MPCPFCYGATLYCSDKCRMADLMTHTSVCANIQKNIGNFASLCKDRMKQMGLNKQNGIFELTMAILQNPDLVNVVKQDVFFVPLSFKVHEKVRNHSHMRHEPLSGLSSIKETSSCIRQAVEWIEKHRRENRSSEEEKIVFAEQMQNLNQTFIEIATARVDEIERVKAEQHGLTFTPLTQTERVLKIVDEAKKERAKPANRRSPFAPDDYVYMIVYPPDLTFAFALAFPANAHNVSLGHKMDNGFFRCQCSVHKV